MLKNRLILTVATAALILGFAQGAFAASTDVGATLDAKQAISLSNVVAMDFGIVEFSAVHGGVIQLATNGAITLAGGFAGLVLSGATAAGSVDIASDNTSAMQISCDTGGILDSGTDTINLTATEMAIGAGVAFGAGTACAGVGVNPMLVANQASVRIGGSIDVTGNALSQGVFSTATGTGTPVTVDVLYQ